MLNTVKNQAGNGPKLCGNCAFVQNFHTRKLGEITVFFAVLLSSGVAFLTNQFYFLIIASKMSVNVTSAGTLVS